MHICEMILFVTVYIFIHIYIFFIIIAPLHQIQGLHCFQPRRLFAALEIFIPDAYCTKNLRQKPAPENRVGLRGLFLRVKADKQTAKTNLILPNVHFFVRFVEEVSECIIVDFHIRYPQHECTPMSLHSQATNNNNTCTHIQYHSTNCAFELIASDNHPFCITRQ